MDTPQVLASTSLVRICTLVHGPSAHRDPIEEQFDVPEIIFTLEDRWGVRSGRGDVIAHPRALILGNAGETYRCRHFAGVPKDKTLGVSYVGFTGPDRGSQSEWRAQLPHPLFDHLAVPLAREFRWYLKQLLREISARRPGFQLKMDALCSSLLVDVVRVLHGHSRTIGRGNATKRRTAEVVEQARAYVDAHFAENIELLTLASIVSMSPFHFSRLFRESAGYSPHQYLIRARLDHAATLLRDTHMSILDVALSAGFQDATHFARSFRRHTGLTPTVYRQGKTQE